jgi:polyisoprenoid-binding protein YceI
VTAQLQSPRVAAGTWAVFDGRTRVTFTVRNFGRPMRGTVACSRGELVVDERAEPVRVAAEIDLDSLDTGIAKRDADLRAPRFLDIDRHPTMAWSADRFSRQADGCWVAEGVLRVRGTSAPLSVTGLPACDPDGSLRVRATATLDRRAFGIRAPRFLVGHVVVVDVDAVLIPRTGR